MGSSTLHRPQPTPTTTRRGRRGVAALAALTLGTSLLASLQPAQAVATVATVVPGAHAVVPAPACSDALLVGVEGGGEGQVDGVGSAALGRSLRPLAEAVVTRAGQAQRTVTVRGVVTTTPGAGVLRGDREARRPAQQVVRRADWRTWAAPVPVLAAGLRTVLADLEACPDQLVYLVGYSQGAQAVHRVLAEVAADADLASRVVGAVLVADPARVGHGVSDRFARTAPASLPTRIGTAPVVSTCARGDLVCDLTGAASFAQARRLHRSYGKEAARTSLAARGTALGARLALVPRPEVDQVVTGQVGARFSTPLGVSVDPAAQDSLRWTVSSALPEGIELSRRGVLHGIPALAGTTPVDYTVRNIAADAVGRPVAGQAELTVAADQPTTLSAGGRHSCVVRGDSTLWCWGDNSEGQLGLGGLVGRRAATQVGTAQDWATVSGGGMHTCAIRTDASLWCWGLNYRGQLGLGDRTDRDRPVQVGTAQDWASVSAGWVHTCATRTDGSAWCWGDNVSGQLGDATTQTRLVPQPVTGGATWRDVQAGGWHTCGIRRNGTAWCWGRNGDGQLGVGDATTRQRPTQVGTGTDWTTLSPSWTHTCGVELSGLLSCWGSNGEQQLGTSAGTSSLVPTPVAGSRRWSEVSTGIGFSCGLAIDTSLWCWGNGRYGQTGSTADASPTPAQVGGADRQTGWVGLDSGWLHSCAVRAGSAARCWGENEVGALGDLTLADRAVPRTVSFAAARTAALDRPRTLLEDPSVGVPAGARPAPRSGPVDVQLVEFNVLGSNHSAPRLDADDYSPARVRSEWALDHLDAVGADIVGFSEIQRDQLASFLRGAGDRYDVWPGNELGSQGVPTTIAWQQRKWERIDSRTVTIPFLTQQRLMPLVHLRNLATGRTIWVMNVHNAPQGFQDQRDRAVELEIQALEQVVGRGEPVLLVGDFNERERAFCEVGLRLGLVAPRGGSVSDGRCTPPSGSLRVDWIFGSPDATYSGYAEDRTPLVKRITDHAVLRTRVSLP